MRCRHSPASVGVLVLTLALPSSAFAHNESVHQRMTDYAYHVMLAAKAQAEGGATSERLRIVLQRLADDTAGMKDFYVAAGKAVDRLHAMKAGLPVDTTPCATGGLIAIVGGGAPNWMLPGGGTQTDARLDQIRLPVTIQYGYGTPVCGLDEAWTPSGALTAVNPGTFVSRDHTGVTLGYWAAAPDKELKDWVLRSSTLETLQHPVVVGAIGASTTVAVSFACGVVCGFFPIACVLCPFVAVGAGGAVIDEITSIDADSLESDSYVGLGHFVDMKPASGGVTFDEKPGKFTQRAGPVGVPDFTEDLVMAGFFVAGMHINHNESLAPTHYEVMLGGSGGIGADFHTNTTHRDKAAWEGPLVSDLQLTAVDNLGMFGYAESRAAAGTSKEPYRLGWPLHALGDASVPMHAVGASGYGHRPYEDCVDMVYDNLVGSANTGASLDTVTQVLQRALVWRTFIQQWRTLHGTTEVPVRDLVTAVAEKARKAGIAQPGVYKPDRSAQYLIDEDGATAGYDNPAMAAIQRDLLIEGIAAELAFLVSVTEVQP